MQKLYYSISEVSKIVDEEQHILRYWEKEFEQLKPRKNKGGNRIYLEKDIHLIKIIKYLLRSEKLSLKGAKYQLKNMLNSKTQEELFSEITNKMHLNNNVINKGIAVNHSKRTLSISLSINETKELYTLLSEIKKILIT